MTAKKEKLPWYKRDPSKFFAGTVGLSWEAKAIYGLVLDLVYDARGKLKNDPARIVNYLGTGMTLQRWARVLQTLLDAEKLRMVDGFITNDKMTRDILRTETKAEEAAAVERRGLETGQETGQERRDLFEATANNVNGLTPPGKAPSSPVPARVRENQTQIEKEESTGDVVIRVAEIAKALGQDRGRYWEADYRRMREEGVEYGDIMEAARAHRGGHMKGLGRLAGLARAKRDARLAGGRTSAPGPEADKPVQVEGLTDRQWEEHLALLLKLGSWDAAKLGPPPTRSGHLVPPGPYRRWLAIWKLQDEHPAQEADTGGNVVPYPSDRPSAFVRAMWEPDGGEET